MKRASVRRPAGRSGPVRAAVLPVLLCLLAAGCAQGIVQTHDAGTSFMEANFVTFEHPFTERAAATALERAQAACRKLKRAAVETARACTLERCTTSYQCMTPEQAEAYRDRRR